MSWFRKKKIKQPCRRQETLAFHSDPTDELRIKHQRVIKVLQEQCPAFRLDDFDNPTYYNCHCMALPRVRNGRQFCTCVWYLEANCEFRLWPDLAFLDVDKRPGMVIIGGPHPIGLGETETKAWADKVREMGVKK